MLLIDEPYNKTAAAQYGRDGGDAVLEARTLLRIPKVKKVFNLGFVASKCTNSVYANRFDRAHLSAYHLSVDHVNKKRQHRSISFRAIKPYPSLLCFWLLSIAWRGILQRASLIGRSYQQRATSSKLYFIIFWFTLPSNGRSL